MRCKTFKISLKDETRIFDEEKLNKFLENVAVRQVFSSVVGDDYWSILVFFESSSTTGVQIQTENNLHVQTQTSAVKQSSAKSNEAEKPAPEPIALTPEQENTFHLLKQWRNERAASDGLPPYMIAQNESLMQIAAADIGTIEDFLHIKGFGEKRAQKYGEEILNIIKSDD
jgi:superfamily II DNA helicase RecQ